MDLKKIAQAIIKTEGVMGLSRDRICEIAGIPAGSFAHYAGCSYGEFLAPFITKMPLTTTPPKAGRINRALRMNHLLGCAVHLAKMHGYGCLTRRTVAELAGVSESNVARLYTVPELRTAVLQHAIKHKILDIVAQGIHNGDPLCEDLPPMLRKAALRHAKV